MNLSICHVEYFIEQKKRLRFFFSKKRYLYSVFRTTSLRIFCAAPLYSLAAQKTGRKKALKAHKKREEANKITQVFYPIRADVSQIRARAFFCFSFCLARYTRLWWLDKKCSCSFDSELWYKNWIFAPKKWNFLNPFLVETLFFCCPM